MVHSEQHKHGKLKYAPEPYFREWCDTLYEKLDEKRQWEKYRALPWEEEAWARSKEFINRIWP